MHSVIKEIKMEVLYYENEVKENAKSIFLAGPALRSNQKELYNWRVTALETLDKLHFDGVVYVPDKKDVQSVCHEDDRINWEWKALDKCTTILFWVPRKIDTLPGFTTNVEFGLYVGSNKVVYGRPLDSEKNHYLDRLYYKYYNIEPCDNLTDTIKLAIKHTNK